MTVRSNDMQRPIEGYFIPLPSTDFTVKFLTTNICLSKKTEFNFTGSISAVKRCYKMMFLEQLFFNEFLKDYHAPTGLAKFKISFILPVTLHCNFTKVRVCLRASCICATPSLSFDDNLRDGCVETTLGIPPACMA